MGLFPILNSGSFPPLGKQNPLKSSENLSSISYGIEKNDKRFQNVDVNHCAILIPEANNICSKQNYKGIVSIYPCKEDHRPLWQFSAIGRTKSIKIF